jgi:hypothetical protein
MPSPLRDFQIAADVMNMVLHPDGQNFYIGVLNSDGWTRILEQVVTLDDWTAESYDPGSQGTVAEVIAGDGANFIFGGGNFGGDIRVLRFSGGAWTQIDEGATWAGDAHLLHVTANGLTLLVATTTDFTLRQLTTPSGGESWSSVSGMPFVVLSADRFDLFLDTILIGANALSAWYPNSAIQHSPNTGAQFQDVTKNVTPAKVTSIIVGHND